MIQNKANQEQFYVCQRGIPPTVTQSAAASSTAHDDYIPKANAEMFKGVKIMTVNMWAACASRTVVYCFSQPSLQRFFQNGDKDQLSLFEIYFGFVF